MITTCKNIQALSKTLNVSLKGYNNTFKSNTNKISQEEN